MIKIIIITFILIVSLPDITFATALVKWYFEASVGDAHCFKTPLTIKQSGYNAINLTASYATNSFKLPIYYSVRISRWHSRRAWEVELVHLKLKLKNKPPQVQRFEISHGFNLVLINHAWAKRKFMLRLGGGVVIAHPENIVYGRSLSETIGIFNQGYYLAGLTMQWSAGRKFFLIRKLFVNVEGKLTGAYARIPVVDGQAWVTNMAAHGVVGLVYEL